MRNLFIILLAIISLCIVSCSRSAQHRQILSDAERIVESNPDSALAMIRDIDVSDINDDGNRALYALVMASAHKANVNSMAGDSLTRFAYNYYRNIDTRRFIKSGELYALYRFWNGEGDAAMALLDSLLSLHNLNDSVHIELLRSKVEIGGSLYKTESNIPSLRKLIKIDQNPVSNLHYRQRLYINYFISGRVDSALVILDELIASAQANGQSDELFEYKFDKIGVLEELGMYAQSIALADSLISVASENISLHFLHFWKAWNYFNMGNPELSAQELALADSSAQNISEDELKYYEGFAGHLRNFIQYRKDGKIRITQFAALTNKQRDNLFRMESTRIENEKNTLRAENRALELKGQNQRKTFIIIIVCLIAIITVIVAIWNIQKRKRRIIEAEERVDALRKMVDELKQPVPAAGQDALRRAMLQQLGIIKMVAETPTEQNREMLRKLSSIESDTNGSLINWDNLYEIINNLYSDFHKKLHAKYANTLTEKEEQVIVLFVAGFSAKEISVITSQSTASIYVRKSSIKKKLDVSEKEDAIAFIRQKLSV